MKATKLFTGLLLMASLFFASGCSKPEGCMDKDATNYDELAEADCSCCTFSGEAVLWYNEQTAIELTNAGVTTLTFYVDGQIIGSSAANVYWTAAPTCGQNASITVTKNLGNAKTQAYNYSVKDQDGYEWYNGVLNINANTCLQLQLN